MIQSESVRWYSVSTGLAVPSVMGLNGKDRPPTLRDARKSGLRRSVTSILKEAAQPGLEVWKRKQLVMAALTLPRPDGMPLDDFINKIEEDAAEEGKRAADLGTEIHTAIQRHIECKPFDDKWNAHVQSVVDTLNSFGIDLRAGQSERSFCTQHYGGCADWISDTAVLDFKTKDAIGKDTKAYDNHGLQLLAYNEGIAMKGLGGRNRRLLNVFIGREDAKVHMHEWPRDEIPRLEAMWSHLWHYSLAKDGLL